MEAPIAPSNQDGLSPQPSGNYRVVVRDLADDILYDRMARRGDANAESELVARYYAYAVNLSRAWDVPGMSAEDLESVALEALVAAVRSWDPVRRTLHSWVRVLVSQRLARQRRRAVKQRIDSSGCFGGVAGTAPSPDRIVAARIIVEQCRSGPGATPLQTEVVSEMLVAGDSVLEVARRRNVSRQSVRRVLQRVRRRIEEEEE